VLGGQANARPKSADSSGAMIRHLKVARDTAVKQAPQSLAKAASERMRSGLSPTRMSISAAVPVEIHGLRAWPARRMRSKPRDRHHGIRQPWPRPLSRQSAKPRNPVSTKSGEGHFAPASWEQAFCSLGCDVSQVVIDCVSESDILLFMQEQ
jgi:hypothetical protein